MENQPVNYKDFFHPGQRATVEVPVAGGKVFNDGAVVTSVGETEIVLRLFCEKLPEGALLHQDAPLVVRIGGSGFGYSCRLVLNEPPGEELKAEFAGPVIPEDTREYFRLGTEIPVVLFNVTAGSAEENGFGGGLRLAGQSALPRIVNISGGGLRTETEMAMNIGDIVYATFHLPLPEQKVVPVVAQVVHTEQVDDEDATIVSAGLTFMHINEKDRDSIVRYVCNEEIKRIKLTRKQLAAARP